jgi:hypothetical protein
MDHQLLDEAYERLLGKGPEFGGDEEGNHGLTNHGPMAMEVAVRRGLDLNVHGWLDRYLPRLIELPSPSERIDETNWRDALGNAKRVGDWSAYFTDQLVDAGSDAGTSWREVLVTWWPRLLPGIVAGSTHGIIRVGHAVRALSAGDESAAARAELARGLGFWAARSRLVPGVTAPTGALDVDAALDQIPRLPDQTGFIAHRLDRLADLHGWPESLSALRAPAAADVPDRLAALTDAATMRYLSYGHGSPVLLVHTATAPNALQHILPVLPRDLWQASFGAVWAASAALVATYAPPQPADRDRIPKPPADSDPQAEALQRAAEHGDEHVIEFTDTAVEVHARTGNPDALAAALHAGNLIRN